MTALRRTSASPPAPRQRHRRASSTGPTIDEPLNDFTRWNEFLAWSLNKVRSSAAFAVDPQGFVIGSSGNVPEDGFEGTGAELSYVMSQADVMNPEMGGLRSIALEFANRRLSGFRSGVTDGEGFVIAFIDAEAFDPLDAGADRTAAGALVLGAAVSDGSGARHHFAAK